MKAHDWEYVLQVLSWGEHPEERLAKGRMTRRQVVAFRRRHRPWLRQRGVTGFAIGRRQVGGQRRREKCVIVYVAAKRPRGRNRHPVPRRLRIPTIGSIATDVQVMPRLKAHGFFAVQRPLQPGCNIGFNLGDSGPGTLTGMVQSTLPSDQNLRLMLSCEHVLCNDLRQRDQILGPAATMNRAIEQPAPRYQDTTLPDYRVGVVYRSGNIQFDGIANRVDAAVAWVTQSVGANNLPLGNQPRIRQIADVADGQRVLKIGSSTGLQFGYVSAPLATVDVDYPPEMPGGATRTAKFTNVVTYQCPCLPGDSGAPVLDANTGALIGLHFAGEGNAAAFCPIAAVFSALQITLAP